MKAAAGLAISASLLLTACAGTPAAITEAPGPDLPDGYVAAPVLDALAAAAPFPPAEGSALAQADQSASDRMRPLRGGDRWLLAAAHAEMRPPVALQHFDCALGVRLAGRPVPALQRLMGKLLHDANSAAEAVKTRAWRPRPVFVDPDRPACERLTPAARASGAFPSGAAAVAVAWAEAFALLAPERAEAVRRLGHEIGVSRLVCGMHHPSDIEAGAALGRAVFEAARLQPEFGIDLEEARTEMAAVRATGLTNPGCEAEAAALARPLP